MPTPSGLPYPSPGDDVADGAVAIKALAEAIDPRLPSKIPVPPAQLALTIGTPDTALQQAGAIPVYNKSGQLTSVDPTLAGHVATMGWVQANSPKQLFDGGGYLMAQGKNLGTSGDLFANGSVYTYGSTPVTNQYVAAYINGDGRIGKSASTRRYKQDIEPLTPAQIQAITAAIYQLQLVTFRYTDVILELGWPMRAREVEIAPAVVDPDTGDEIQPQQTGIIVEPDADWEPPAPTREIGLIAEDLHVAGLEWLVFYDGDGLPEGIHYERIALALLPVLQDHEQRLLALEERV